MRTTQQTVFITVSALVLGLLATASSAQNGVQNVESSSDLFTKYPAARNQSVSPSSDSVPAVGPSSASPASAMFVPQIAQYGGEAEPILVAQVEYISDVVIAPQNYWAFILDRYISHNNDGLDNGGLAQFDYAKLKNTPADMDGLNAYITHMTQQKPSELSRNDAMAYWANFYNALTVQVVTQNYPVKSIRKIKSGYRAGPWKRKLVTVEGNELSLDNIEHDILRPTYKTPLVHYMVNCASIGCPNLKATPWQGATLIADQEAAARAYINSSRGVKISDNRLQVSKIYKWFKVDFGDNTAGVLAHLSEYAATDLRAALEGRRKIDKYTYDWAVNAPK